MTELEEFQEKDNGWALSNIVNLGANINKFTLQLGPSYIELPNPIKRKQAYINVKNDDIKCFAWAVLSAFYPAGKHPQRTSKYPHYAEEDGQRFKVLPTYLKKIKKIKNVNLLLIQDKYDDECMEDFDNSPIRYLYVWIKIYMH